MNPNVPGYAAITRRYMKPDGTTYMKQVWVRADRARRERARMTARPTRSPEQLSLFDLAMLGCWVVRRLPRRELCYICGKGDPDGVNA
jgi:hypothetical protein